MKQRIRKIIYNFLYSHPLITMHSESMSNSIKSKVIHDLCSRVSIDKMREILDEAEKQGGQKYTTLGRLLEENFNSKKCVTCQSKM